MADMTKDIFAVHSYGQIALKRINPTSENFRLFEAGWLGRQPKDFNVMEIRGAEFRVAKAGPNKGKLSVMVPGTTRNTYVTL